MSNVDPCSRLELILERCGLVFDRILFNRLVTKRPDISRQAVISVRERLLVWRLGVEAGWDWSDASLHCRTCRNCRVASQDLLLEYNAHDPAQERERPVRY